MTPAKQTYIAFFIIFLFEFLTNLDWFDYEGVLLTLFYKPYILLFVFDDGVVSLGVDYYSLYFTIFFLISFYSPFSSPSFFFD